MADGSMTAVRRYLASVLTRAGFTPCLAEHRPVSFPGCRSAEMDLGWAPPPERFPCRITLRESGDTPLLTLMEGMEQLLSLFPEGGSAAFLPCGMLCIHRAEDSVIVQPDGSEGVLGSIRLDLQLYPGIILPEDMKDEEESA